MMDEIATVAKRRRSAASRRPRMDSQALLEGRDPSPPSSDNGSKNSSDGSSSLEAGAVRKELNLNSLVPKISSRHEGPTSSRRPKKEEIADRDYDKFQNRGNEGSFSYSSAKNSSRGSLETMDQSENRVRKVKLKVGGVTRTIHAKSNGESGVEGGGGSSLKGSKPDDSSRHRQRIDSGEKVDPWKNFGDQGFFRPSKEFNEKLQTSAGSEPVRKSKRVPKRRVLDGAFDGDDADEEIRYLERLKAAKLSMEQQETSGSENKKRLKGSKALKRSSYEEDDDFSLQPRSREGRKKPRSDRDSEDREDVDEEEGASDTSHSPRKKAREESLESLADTRKEVSLTTRQRALQTGRDGTGGSANNLIEFPDGLPPAPPRRQKGKLSEVEQQLKKAEAAQRRRLQVEKAARESEAEAIRKILGQDSNRKKREEKLQKKREEMAQEKAAKFIALAGNTVRWVLGPDGTVVTFPEAVGLPSIFDSEPRSYPAPRERCAGPSCTNPYRYRHSKLNLPLCSLHCYKAVEQTVHP
ncbi:uncharacterized protein LOC144711126 [Wolffia australiana]